MYYLLLFHSTNGYANVPQYYIKRTLPLMLNVPMCYMTFVFEGVKYLFQTVGIFQRHAITLLTATNASWMKPVLRSDFGALPCLPCYTRHVFSYRTISLKRFCLKCALSL